MLRMDCSACGSINMCNRMLGILIWMFSAAVVVMCVVTTFLE
jgi:hypothetical protein